MRKTTKEQALNPEFKRDAQNYAAKLVEELNLTKDDIHDWITDEYRDLKDTITDEDGNEEFLDMECFETKYIATWFRDFCKRVPDHVTPRIHESTILRLIVFTSILRARDPARTQGWGIR